MLFQITYKNIIGIDNKMKLYYDVNNKIIITSE